MTKSLYIFWTERATGKAAIVLATMQMLVASAGKVTFFRPIIGDVPENDSLMQLLHHQYNSTKSLENNYGVSKKVALSLINSSLEQQLYKKVLIKYKKLQLEYDFILCLGTDLSSLLDTAQFDLNLDLAHHLNSSLLPVIKGYQSELSDLINKTNSLHALLKQHNTPIISTIINRVNPLYLDQLTHHFASDTSVYCVSETSALSHVTLGDICKSFQASILSGSSSELSKEVSHYHVASMQINGFINTIKEGSLVICSADRSDIILASLLTSRSKSTPNVSGIILTNKDDLDRHVKEMILGLPDLTIGILEVSKSMLETIQHMSTIHTELHPNNVRKISSAIAHIEASVDFSSIKEKILTSSTHRVTPLMFEHDLIYRAQKDIKHIVLPEGDDERILKASEILLLRKAVKLTLLGDPTTIKNKIVSLGLSLSGVNIIDPLDPVYLKEFSKVYFKLRKHKGITLNMAYDTMQDVSYFATMMVHLNYADAMVSGAAHTTAHTVRPSFEIIKTKPNTKIVSSVFFMCLRDKVLVYGDCAINQNPTAQELADIAISSAHTAKVFNIDPHVAMLSYSTGTSGTGTMVDKVKDATRIAQEIDPKLSLDGPMQYDTAVDKAVAHKKMPMSNVAGKATVFIFPDLNTGNNTYKAVQRSANAIAIGPILQGLNKPVNDLSRGCLVADVVNTIVITAIQAQLS